MYVCMYMYQIKDLLYGVAPFWENKIPILVYIALVVLVKLMNGNDTSQQSSKNIVDKSNCILL